jgi:hypothetical protein
MLGGTGIVGFIFDDAKEEGRANNPSLGACSVFTRLGEESPTQATKQAFNLDLTCGCIFILVLDIASLNVPRRCLKRQPERIQGLSNF